MENGGLLTDDQYFLIYFIMGTYFAPHLNNVKMLKSPLQRQAENLPPYNPDDLVNSKIKTTVMEKVYYYILRKAKQSVIVKRPLLLQFIDGNLPLPLETYPQFHNLFPSNLHPHSQFENEPDTIDSIIFLENPEIGYLMQEHIERFKILTWLEDFCLDMESAMLHLSLDDDEVLYNNYSNLVSNCEIPSDQGTVFLPCCPNKEEWSKLVSGIGNGFAVTGSAATGEVGPVLGLMDIGESEDSYLFRVSLPGVKRAERDFSCEVESNGMVLIKGVTVTGERTVEKYSQTFVMQSQNLCPPGPFSISFMLPGPVNPQQFHGTFSTDGILEGLALKARSH